MLIDHPNVVGINEPQIGYYLGPFLCDQPGIDPAELDLDTFTLRRLQARAPHHIFADAYRDTWAPALAQLMEARFRAQAERHPARAPLAETVIVVKEPNGSQSADILLGCQPRARLLFLLRDGRDVVDSELAANEAGSWVSSEFPGVTGIGQADRLGFVIQSAHKWLWRTEVVEQAFAAHPGPKLLVRYEDLRAAPEAHVARILRWLGLPDDDAHVEQLVEPHRFEAIPEADRGRDRFYRAASPGQWAVNLTAEEQAAVHAVLGSKLAELGYAVPS